MHRSIYPQEHSLDPHNRPLLKGCPRNHSWTAAQTSARKSSRKDLDKNNWNERKKKWGPFHLCPRGRSPQVAQPDRVRPRRTGRHLHAGYQISYPARFHPAARGSRGCAAKSYPAASVQLVRVRPRTRALAGIFMLATTRTESVRLDDHRRNPLNGSGTQRRSARRRGFPDLFRLDATRIVCSLRGLSPGD